MACCHDAHCASVKPFNSPRWRRALWLALVVNAGFFLTEVIAGAAAGSSALQADALDFFGDAANYAVSPGVAGMTLAWRARAAIAKGGTTVAFALWVLSTTAWHAFYGTLPRAAHPLVPSFDRISQRWLARSRSPYVGEIAAIADALEGHRDVVRQP